MLGLYHIPPRWPILSFLYLFVMLGGERPDDATGEVDV